MGRSLRWPRRRPLTGLVHRPDEARGLQCPPASLSPSTPTGSWNRWWSGFAAMIFHTREEVYEMVKSEFGFQKNGKNIVARIGGAVGRGM